MISKYINIVFNSNFNFNFIIKYKYTDIILLNITIYTNIINLIVTILIYKDIITCLYINYTLIFINYGF
jgi:hypothetical protein